LSSLTRGIDITHCQVVLNYYLEERGKKGDGISGWAISFCRRQLQSRTTELKRNSEKPRSRILRATPFLKRISRMAKYLSRKQERETTNEAKREITKAHKGLKSKKTQKKKTNKLLQRRQWVTKPEPQVARTILRLKKDIAGKSSIKKT